MAKVSKSRSKKSRQREKKSAARRRRPKRSYALATLVVFALWLSAFLMLLGVKPFYSSSFLVGQSAPATVVAMTDFDSLDLARTELDRQQAASETLPVFTVDMSAYERSVRQLGAIFDLCGVLRGNESTNTAALGESARKLEELLRQSNIELELDEIMNLVPEPPEAQDLLKRISEQLRMVAARGIASSKEKSEAFQGVASIGAVAVESEEEGPSYNVAVDKLMTPEDASLRLVQRLLADSDQELSRKALTELLRPLISPNLKFNPKLTEEHRKEARLQTPKRSQSIRKGEIIVNIGDSVTPQISEHLLAHKERLNETSTLSSRVLRRLGQGCLLLAGMIACLGLFAMIRPRPDSSPSALLLILSISILVLLSVRGLICLSAATRILPAALIDSLFPLALAAIMAGLLIDSSIALVLGAWVSLAAAVMFDNSFVVLLQGFAVSVVAALGVRNVRKRSQVFRAGLLIGLLMMLLHTAFGIYHNQPVDTVVTHSIFGLVNGIVCASLALFLVPFMEYIFGRTTDIRLLELSDMSHPLLRRLAIEAPGTYHHSLMMASLAQAAADEIGANSLLVRVCAYFHDIGKLSKPAFFAENIKGGHNPHDELSPNMSMLVIAAHVKEGVTLAKRHKLPKPIVAAIREHHAAGTVKYFYHRAMREAEAEKVKGNIGASRFDGEHFRYDCPRPHSREMAILSMADSVEAASRTLEKSAPSRIEALVDGIIDSKIKDHQLDESDLTMAQINAIKRSFVFTITNMKHGRVEYPKDEESDEDRDSRPSEGAQDRDEQARTDRTDADEEGGATQSES